MANPRGYHPNLIGRDPQGAGIECAVDREGNALVSSLRAAWRDDFNGTDLNPAAWEILSQGPGQSYSLAGGELTINAGTGAGEEIILRSRLAYTIPIRVWWIGRLSQRIASQEIRLEVTNAAGDMVAGWLFDGTSATNGKYYSANGGTLVTSGSTSINTTASDMLWEIELNPDECWFAVRTADSAGAKSYAYVRQRNIPDPQQDYYLQARITNGASAPASNTQLILGAALAQDINELTAEITGGRGDTYGGKAVGVYLTNQPTLSATPWTGIANHHTAISAASTNATLVRNAQTGLYMLHALNEHPTLTRYLKLYNKASAPVVGTDVPVLVYPLKPGVPLILNHDIGWRFITGLAYAITGGQVNADATAIGAGDVVVNMTYAT